MKKLSLILALLSYCVLGISANNMSFVVEGIAPKDATTISVINANTNKTIGMVDVKDGRFQYKGKLPADTYLMFSDPKSRMRNYVITDGESIQLDMTKDMASGTPLTERLYALADTIGALQETILALGYKVQKTESDEERKALRTKIKESKQNLQKRIEKLVAENKDNCLPVFFLTYNYYNIPFDLLVTYSESGDKYTRHPMFKGIKERVEKQKPQYALVGKKYINTTIKDGAGKSHKLSEHIGLGNYVLVDFWASWCGPCLAEIPTLAKCYDKYKSKGFNIIGVSLDHDRSKWIGAISKNNLCWSQFCDFGAYNSPIAQTYNVHSIPWNFLCDGEGKIIAVNLRGDNLTEKLEVIFGE